MRRALKGENREQRGQENYFGNCKIFSPLWDGPAPVQAFLRPEGHESRDIETKTGWIGKCKSCGPEGQRHNEIHGKNGAEIEDCNSERGGRKALEKLREKKNGDLLEHRGRGLQNLDAVPTR